ncbi:hypothetical protein FRB99_002856, partial [Tulasnella sp. 403]
MVINGGTGLVYVDGVELQTFYTVAGNDEQVQCLAPWFSKSDLAPGNHVLVVKVTGVSPFGLTKQSGYRFGYLQYTALDTASTILVTSMASSSVASISTASTTTMSPLPTTSQVNPAPTTNRPLILGISIGVESRT